MMRLFLLALFGLMVVAIVWSLLRSHRLVDSQINLDDLLIGDDGKLSKASVVMFGAFAVTTWGMVFMWINKTMSEGYFTAYIAAWIVPTVTVLVTRAPPKPPSQEPQS